MVTTSAPHSPKPTGNSPTLESMKKPMINDMDDHTTEAHEVSASIMPVKRNMHFKLDSAVAPYFHGRGHFVSLFFAALSIFFPAGETMFVKSVQRHRHIWQQDPLLREQAAGFVQQETIHGREHEIYNEAICETYPGMRRIEAIGATLCRWVLTYLPIRMQLSATVALEHWTGILAGALLEYPQDNFGGDRSFGLIWHWHALEETEHKAVAYDVYIKAYGYGVRSWIDRQIALFLGTILLWTMVWAGFFTMTISDGSIFNLYEWGQLFYFQWVYPGQFRLAFLPFWDFLLPNFHPWQHNNKQHLLVQMPKMEKMLANAEYSRK